MKALPLVALSLALVSVLRAQTSSANYRINPQSVTAGGGAATSANYTITASSVGGIFGRGSSANYSATSGYVEQLLTIGAFAQGIDLTDYASWLTQFPSIPPAEGDRGDDPDGDGVSNEEEFLALTDPTDSGSRLVVRILSVDRATNHSRISFFPYETDTGLRTYSLLSRNDLSGAFAPVSGLNPTSASGAGLFTDTRILPDRRFYQIRIAIPD